MWSSSPQNLQVQYNHENRKIPIEGHPARYLTSTPQNCQDPQNPGKSEKLSKPGGT